ncbi:MAG: D-tyrosyl-tRNA(Tyr) deacylase [Candidatus Pacearchaeota archaeon]|nr:MAG: D-tyrosyl-tRNA(Tyr) deacylase [Candidatus Pacearchaeota archaeon]
MYKKFLIVASNKDKAGMNITTNLTQFGNFNLYICDKEIIYTENLDLERINDFDFIVFASKHVSESKEKTIAVHAAGNWRVAQYGGISGKVCKSSGLFMKYLFEKLYENIERYSLKDYKLTMEATHHGPLINKPCLFLEIGSTDFEWSDRRAGFVVARALAESIKTFRKDENNEVAIAIGGPHYCPNFNKIQLKTNIAISHVIPKYALPLTSEIIEEALNKTEELVDIAVLDWDGLGKQEERERILKILNNYHINYRKSSEIKKDFGI